MNATQPNSLCEAVGATGDSPRDPAGRAVPTGTSPRDPPGRSGEANAASAAHDSTAALTPVTLTAEQTRKLDALAEDMRRKAEARARNSERNERSARETGIPLSVIDLDVVQFAMIAGFVGDRDNLECSPARRRSSPPSMLRAMLLGDGAANGEQHRAGKPNYERVPSYYVIADDAHRADETARTAALHAHVGERCAEFSRAMRVAILRETDELARNDVILERADLIDIDAFRATCERTLDFYVDEMMDAVDDADRVSIAHQLRAVKTALVAFLPIHEYATIARSLHRRLSRDDDVTPNGPQRPLGSINIAKLALTTIDRWLLRREDDDDDDYKEEGDDGGALDDVERLRLSTIVAQYTRDPQLVPFSMRRLIRRCCTPLIFFVHAREIIDRAIVGPYRHDPVGFLYDANYYVLNDVVDSVRLWTLDADATSLTEHLRDGLYHYYRRAFRAAFLRRCVRVSVRAWSGAETQSIGAARTPAAKPIGRQASAAKPIDRWRVVLQSLVWMLDGTAEDRPLRPDGRSA
jgi:hypothetical protein